ncbi:MAG: HEAT repeat domain-containing protein [Planctomycetota bacterium]|nr:HEAT repeat domain-containing protein [Planctomycetota bacterium]
MRGQRTRRGAAAACLLAILALAACSSQQKKLASDEGSVLDGLVYGTLGMDRDTTYYYQLVRDSHDRETFAYRPSADTYLVDKNVDAVQRLGHAPYARLEGQAQVVALLIDVLLEDRSSLAQANAANSLTLLAMRLPRYPARGLVERGDRFLALIQELDGIWQPTGACTSRPAYARERTVAVLNEMGAFEMASISIAKDTLIPFYTRDYLIDATEPSIRTAADTALTRRMGDAIRLALRAGVDADEAFVREESVRGLKTLVDRGGARAVLGRLEVETNWRVRAEMTEYLARVGGEDAVARLLPLLEDGDPSMRNAARKALARIAGRDLGFRRATWTRWAHATYPVLAARAAEAAAEAARDEDEDGGPTPGMP